MENEVLGLKNKFKTKYNMNPDILFIGKNQMMNIVNSEMYKFISGEIEECKDMEPNKYMDMDTRIVHADDYLSVGIIVE